MYTVIPQRDPRTRRTVYIVYRVTRDAVGAPLYTAIYSHTSAIIARMKARRMNQSQETKS
ncbi:MAG: hypothetical protein M0Z43_02955 [Acidithiobacillus sp.]|nr:hypothetical protein [Acidithiobacillus sp.]